MATMEWSPWKARATHIRDRLRALGIDCEHVTVEVRGRSKFRRFGRTVSERERFLSLSAVEDRTTLKKSTIYALIAQDAFPPPIPITRRRVAWHASDIQSWINACYARHH